MSSPTRTADHLLHVKLGAEGYWGYRLECIEGRCPGTSFVQRARDEECRCEPKCEWCADGDHAGCPDFGMYIEDIGYECQCDVDESQCWTQTWLDEVGDELIHGDNWPEDAQLPLPVSCEWGGDCLEIHWAGDAS